MPTEKEYTQFLCETRLFELDRDLHQRYKDGIVVMMNILNRYQKIFPTFTDHTILHSMDVAEFCNFLIDDYISALNADELYILLMGCYLHDVGMGVSESDYEEFSKTIDFGDYFDTHSREDHAEIVRFFHSEFSGTYINKYATLFDIPSKEHVFSIIQVARGHRKVDLFDEAEYPKEVVLSNGNLVHLPYLAVLVRLADELDVTKGRNISFLFNMEGLTEEKELVEFGKHEAITALTFQEDSFLLDIETEDEKTLTNVKRLLGKMQLTLDYCVEVVDKRTPFEIRQKTIIANFK